MLDLSRRYLREFFDEALNGGSGTFLINPPPDAAVRVETILGKTPRNLKVEALPDLFHAIACNLQLGSLPVFQADDKPSTKPGAYFFDVVEVK